eukprot:CAMPEP_0173134456 /NCGR_PEP_ID=MMETSP1105-20130129/1300_1 /TAXON_ID=2985 /ORGANISM="Ochromonas sp., Strain BG-1" /LENGTH=75 /DNA_ID=CAMNT_0014046253 /DNA_START=98 /DNA_END=325 /DNA_ORIENTATION=+
MSAWRFVNPAHYWRSYKLYVKDLTKEIRAGSGEPFVKAMVLVGVAGYSVEYTQVGKHHVAAKQKIIEEAMKNHHH